MFASPLSGLGVVMQVKFGRAAYSKHSFGYFLKTVREGKGVNQGELAERVGITQASLSRIESGGTSVTIQRAAMLFEAIGETVSCEFDKCGGVKFRVYRDGLDSPIRGFGGTYGNGY